MRRRFAEHWVTLEAETFRPLIRRARERDAELSRFGSIDWRLSLLALVTEDAYWWGRRLAAEPAYGSRLRDAVDELHRVDLELHDLAGRMADLLERGADLRSRFAIAAEWTPPGPDLWDLLEEVAQWPRYQGTCLDSLAGLGPFLRYMRGTSRPVPELVDIFSALAACTPGEPYALYASDAELLSKGRGARPDAWPTHVRQLYAKLACLEWDDRRGRPVSALDCFNAAMLSPLASVAAGFDPFHGGPPGLGVEAIEKALQRFRAGPAAQ